MEKVKKIWKVLLFPKTYIVIICALAAAGLLIYTFAYYGESGPVAYFSYFFSAYALVIFCIDFVPAVKKMKSHVYKLAEGNQYAYRYMTDFVFKTQISHYLSLVMNVAYAVLKFSSAVYYRSAWLVTLAAYYILLSTMRGLLFRHIGREKNDVILEWKKCRTCGIVLAFMNIILIGMVILVLSKGEGFVYAGYLIYVIAMYDFYTITVAVINLVKSMKHKSPVLSAAKAVNMAAALISILSLETAMITQFGEESSEEFRYVMIAATGGSICAIMLGMAGMMIYQATVALKKGNFNNL